MTDPQNTLLPDNKLAYEKIFKMGVDTNVIEFITTDPFIGGSQGNNLYHVVLQQNSLWIPEPVYLRWKDSEKILVAGLHTTGVISGVRLYYAGNGAEFRKPIAINANPSATVTHSSEESLENQLVVECHDAESIF